MYNIYKKDSWGNWLQADSHHSLDDGSPNIRNIYNDTKSDGVLVSKRFAYWGSRAISIPDFLLDHNGETLLIARGYRSHFSDEFIATFISWFDGLQVNGYLGTPFRWHSGRASWSGSQ